MYIDSISLENFRIFRESKIDFVHLDQHFTPKRLPRPKLPNINLLLGDNGLGKTTLLKAIALAALGPAVGDSGIFPYHLVRQEPQTKADILDSFDIEAQSSMDDMDDHLMIINMLNAFSINETIFPSGTVSMVLKQSAKMVIVDSVGNKYIIRKQGDKLNLYTADNQPQEAVIKANFVPHEQDQIHGVRYLESSVSVSQRGDLESLRWTHSDEKLWHPIFSSSSDAFFFVGYGATRRVEKQTQVDLGARTSSDFVRAQRIKSLFEEAYSLIPLSVWLPEFEYKNPRHFKQVVNLINKFMGKEHYNFTGEMEDGEYLFHRKGLEIPFPALSDGYRAFLGWLGDLFYHICKTCPKDKDLVDNKGIVMVDEIDLHLHPEWQMTVLQTLGETLPNIQFILTSHSPIIAGSLEWMNIIKMEPGPKQSSQLKRINKAVHGLDADQVLLTDFFGLESTRAPGKERALKELTLKARNGDTDAAKELLKQMSRGMEDDE